MSNHMPEYVIQKRRIAAVKTALNTPNLPLDMQNYWRNVLTYLTRRKTMITDNTQIKLSQLQNGLEEITFLLEEILRALKSEDAKKRGNVTSLSDLADNKHH
mgnify:FL=1|jgi:hypothetical protein|tara:strand:- start:1020 stop:1325 length:306 start_codon:yes stop_codon:yes gene_type:complete